MQDDMDDYMETYYGKVRGAAVPDQVILDENESSVTGPWEQKDPWTSTSTTYGVSRGWW